MNNILSRLVLVVAASALFTASSGARAEATPTPTPTPTPLPPYSIPWGLRPMPAVTVLRLETSLARYENAASEVGLSPVAVLTGSYRIEGTGPKAAGLAPMVRVALAGDVPPSASTPSGTIVSNPLVGAAYALRSGSWRGNALLGLTLPIGGGGGNTPDAGNANARAKAFPARMQLDNALFAVNDLTVAFGVSGGYVDHGVTLQAEATVLHLMRVRGEGAQKETSKTNFTSGVHAGYFFTPWLSGGLEVRYQRWISAPLAVEADVTGATQDNLSFAVGPRFHVKLGSLWFRPSVAYERGLDKPLASAQLNYHTVRLDLPLLF